MKERLSIKEYLLLSSMLFGMFFGSGNLIFPVYIGYQSGENLVLAFLGFSLTAIIVPFLGICAMGVSKYEGIHKLQDKVGKLFGTFFTISLYLAVGPLFAIPRSCTLSYTVALSPYVPLEYKSAATPLFSFIFFNIVVFFSIKPKKFMTMMGKFFNPFFLLALGLLLSYAFMRPLSNIFNPCFPKVFEKEAILKGALEGYNTLDVLASLAFGILLVTSINTLGIFDKKKVSKISIQIGAITFFAILIVYLLLASIGSSCRHLIHPDHNGGEALQIIANRFLGSQGSILIGLLITFACLKTAISLVTASASSFHNISGGRISYNFFAVIFSLISFGLSNFGLSGIIKFSIPFIIFLYPLAIMVIILLLLDGFLNLNRLSVKFTLYLTSIFAFFDALRVLSLNNLSEIPTMETPISTFFSSAFQLDQFIPFFGLKLSWIVFALFGLKLTILVTIIEKIRNYLKKNKTLSSK